MENNNERTNKATYGDNSFSEYRNKSAWRMCFCCPDGETGDGRREASSFQLKKKLTITGVHSLLSLSSSSLWPPFSLAQPKTKGKKEEDELRQ